MARTGDLFFWDHRKTSRNLAEILKIGVNYAVFIWQGVNETKKVKNPCINPCTKFVVTLTVLCLPTLFTFTESPLLKIINSCITAIELIRWCLVEDVLGFNSQFQA